MRTSGVKPLSATVMHVLIRISITSDYFLSSNKVSKFAACSPFLFSSALPVCLSSFFILVYAVIHWFWSVCRIKHFESWYCILLFIFTLCGFSPIGFTRFTVHNGVFNGSFNGQQALDLILFLQLLCCDMKCVEIKASLKLITNWLTRK